MTKKNLFSKDLFNLYLNKIKGQDSPEKRKFMVKSIISWLDWLKSSNTISVSEYNASKSKLQVIDNEINTSNVNFDIKKFNDNFTTNNSNVIIYVLILILFVFNFFFIYFFVVQNNVDVDSNTAGRVLPFKGTIKETDGRALDTKRDVVFKIYNSSTDGNVLYTGECIGEFGIEPSFNGNFTILIGSDCGMEPIPEEYFKSNNTLYLGVTIGNDSELSPRHQIFTSTLASNTGKLQGYTLGKNLLSIPYIDDKGHIEIESDSPIIKSSDGEFSIEGQSLLFKTTQENGSITLDPSIGGDVFITSGRLGIGTFKPSSIIDLHGSTLFGPVVNFSNFVKQDDENTSVLKLNIGTPIEGTNTQFVEFYAGSNDSQKGVKVGNIKLNNGGVVYETEGADFAEYFNLDSSELVNERNMLSISSTGIHKSYPNEKIIGVVSNSAGFIGNNIYSEKKNKSRVLVALVGQVEVNVSNINGFINIGDKIGATMIPGYGGKAEINDSIVGYVIESDSTTFTNENCPAYYRSLTNFNGEIISCGIVKLLIDLD